MLVKLGRHSLSWHEGTVIDAAKAWKAQLCHGMGEL